jgi:hypothetical protein
MSHNLTESRRLLLIARHDDSRTNLPLGERDSVASILKELLPRLAFDEDWNGTYKRGTSELIVQLAGDPVMAIELWLPADAAALMPPLERVTAKTGWQLIDPERGGELVFPSRNTVAARATSSRRVVRWAAALLLLPLVAASLWWAVAGSQAYVIAPRPGSPNQSLPAVRTGPGALSGPSALGDGLPELNARMPKSMTVEEFTEQARQVGAFVRRARALAPEFRDLRVVHELLTIDQAEVEFQASLGNGRYVDPVRLATNREQRPFPEMPGLAPEFAVLSRGGYRFEFTGAGEGTTFVETYNPGYSSYVYTASPEPGMESRYTFALHSETGRIHYTTDGRPPTTKDPSVTDRVAVDAPEGIKEVAPQENETGLMSGLRRFINSFLRSAPMQEAELAFHEDRAIRDLRAFAAAQQVFLGVLQGRGYGSADVLSEPSILEGAPPIPPFLDRSFTQEVREGYRFTFAGEHPTAGSGRATLYRDYSYVATPVGNGPTTRRSFALFTDGLIRVRTGGGAAQKTDPFLGSER